MKSIKVRLTINFMFIIIFSVFILELFLVSIVRYYYYNNIRAIMSNQIKISSEFYNRYFSDNSIEDIVLNNIDVFWEQTNAQVQIIDLKGNVLMDSIGMMHKNKISTTDFTNAVSGKQGSWIGEEENASGKTMAVSYPLRSKNKIIGVIRFISSLSEVDSQISKVSATFMLIGAAVIIIVGITSFFIANSIVEPIKELNVAARQFALGDFKAKTPKRNDDEIGELSDTLNYMAGEIEKKEQLKNDFISSISHELRTPLTIIKGWAVTLNSDEELEDGILKDGLSLIEKESDRLTGMVEELLDFSKFVSGRITLHKEKTDIQNVLEQIHMYFQLRAERENKKFVVNCSNISEVDIDRNRIKQVMINVIDNAFKFTEAEDSITVSCDSDNNYVYITIEDDGCGISEDDLPKVKEKFYKGKNIKSSNGIGLSISDEIVKLHGGTLNIDSKLGSGTAVMLSLPLS
ncbi:sensor histidine kinase [Clostridium oryzae]|uniref:histidine kinase n=1 Tax=Clostridium oryzae TaxID=1450648 RepID=A0A1V4IQY7_9CLOT|nr:HAMP domain-containing sensor histidine kinase [Clostridium oryzae]OPJ62448.1 signal transduction histidine-protein kinase BaeS [Clostridium oryzae]